MHGSCVGCGSLMICVHNLEMLVRTDENPTGDHWDVMMRGVIDIAEKLDKAECGGECALVSLGMDKVQGILKQNGLPKWRRGDGTLMLNVTARALAEVLRGLVMNVREHFGDDVLTPERFPQLVRAEALLKAEGYGT